MLRSDSDQAIQITLIAPAAVLGGVPTRLLRETNDVNVALAREKQLKGWLRAKKIALIETENPEWKDISLEWYD